MGYIFRIIALVLCLSAYSHAGDAPKNFVTSVTASSPMSSSGGFTPNLSIPQASNSQSGYLFSGDWTTFNNKVSGPAGSSSYIQYNDTVFGGDSNFTWDKTNLIFKAGLLGFDPTFISDWLGDVSPTLLKRGSASTGALQIATEDSTSNTAKIVMTTGKITSGDLSVGAIEIVGGPNYGTGNAGSVSINGGYQNTLNHSGASLQVGGATPTGDGRIQTSGGIDLSGYKLTAVATPTTSTDGATKGYVDSYAVNKAGDVMTGSLGILSNEVQINNSVTNLGWGGAPSTGPGMLIDSTIAASTQPWFLFGSSDTTDATHPADIGFVGGSINTDSGDASASGINFVSGGVYNAGSNSSTGSVLFGTGKNLGTGSNGALLFVNDGSDPFAGPFSNGNTKFVTRQFIVNTSAGSSFTGGNVDLNSNKIVNLTDPSTAQDAATKNYVDTHATSYTFSSPLVNTGGTISIPVSSASANGYLSSTDWSTFNSKQSALTFGNLTDVGTDGITVTGGTSAVKGSGTSLSQHVADSTHNGYLSSTDWGTFNGKQAALNIGNFTDAGTDGITVTGGTGSVIGSGTSLSQHVSDSTHNGYLSSTDWGTFNSKQSTLSFTAPIVNTGGTVAMAAATSGNNGYLTSTDWSTFNGKMSSIKIACFRDQKTAGTDGGTFTSGAWRTRDITNIDDNGTGITVSSNQLSIPAGTYAIMAYLPAFNIPNRHVGRLQNITDSSTILDGQNNSSEGAGPFTFALIQGIFTLSGTKTVEVQHRAQSTVATIGFGRSVATTLSANFEIYTQGCILRLN